MPVFEEQLCLRHPAHGGRQHASDAVEKVPVLQWKLEVVRRSSRNPQRGKTGTNQQESESQAEAARALRDH